MKILPVLARHDTIVSLDLSSTEGLQRNRLGMAGVECLAHYLKQGALWTFLNLASTGIGNEELALIS